VPVGACQRAFAAAAAADGVVLGGQAVPWLSERGHLALPAEAADAVAVLERIYLALGGDLDVLATARPNRLRGDFVREPTGNLIEIDESQHFTSFRAKALRLYPKGIPLGFELERYLALCEKWQVKADRYRRTKAAAGSATVAASASAPITTRCAISLPRRWDDRPRSASMLPTMTEPEPTAVTASGC
jgi:hypothetical protein